MFNKPKGSKMATVKKISNRPKLRQQRLRGIARSLAKTGGGQNVRAHGGSHERARAGGSAPEVIADTLDARVVVAQGGGVTGLQQITSPDLGTPKAAMILSVYAASDDATVENDMNFSWGLTDGVNQNCVTLFENHDTNPTDSSRGTFTNRIMHDIQGGAIAEFSQFITNGIEINFTTANPSDFYFLVILFGGTIDAAVGTMVVGAQADDTAQVTGLSFDPGYVMMLGNGQSNINNIDPSVIFSVGMGDASGQRTFQLASRDALPTGARVTGRDSTSRIGGQVYNDSAQYALELTSLDTGGFTITTRDGASGSDVFTYLALKTADEDYDVDNQWLWSSGNLGVSLSFDPAFLMFIQSPENSQNNLRTDNRQTTLTFGFADADLNECSIGIGCGEYGYVNAAYWMHDYIVSNRHQDGPNLLQAGVGSITDMDTGYLITMSQSPAASSRVGYRACLK